MLWCFVGLFLCVGAIDVSFATCGIQLDLNYNIVELFCKFTPEQHYVYTASRVTENVRTIRFDVSSWFSVNMDGSLQYIIVNEGDKHSCEQFSVPSSVVVTISDNPCVSVNL